MQMHENLKGSEARLWQLIDERTHPAAGSVSLGLYDGTALVISLSEE